MMYYSGFLLLGHNTYTHILRIESVNWLTVSGYSVRSQLSARQNDHGRECGRVMVFNLYKQRKGIASQKKGSGTSIMPKVKPP